jgi:prepilin-type N-terminal cleavage/methylation domain-containing protein
MSDRRGFTLVEVLVAVVILAIGMMALAASTGAITRTLFVGRKATQAAQVANLAMDRLRAASSSTSPGCTSVNFASSASASTQQGVTLTWVVPASGLLRTVRVMVNYPIGRGLTKTDTLASSVACL